MPDRPAASMLDAFCLAHDISTYRLADISDVSRQHTGKVRFAKTDIRLRFAKKLARGASLIVGRKVPVGELFDMEFELP